MGVLNMSKQKINETLRKFSDYMMEVQFSRNTLIEMCNVIGVEVSANAPKLELIHKLRSAINY